MEKIYSVICKCNSINLFLFCDRSNIELGPECALCVDFDDLDVDFV